MAVHPDLVLWYHFDTNTGGSGSLSPENQLGPDLTQNGSGHSFDADRGLVIDGVATSNIRGALSAAEITAIHSGGSAYIRLDLNGTSVGSKPCMMLYNFNSTPWLQFGIANGMGSVYALTSTGYETDSVASLSQLTEIRMAMYWETNSARLAVDGSFAAAEDTLLTQLSDIDQIKVGSHTDNTGIVGAIREMRYYSTVDGSTGDRDQWIADLSSGLILESVPSAGSAFAFARSTLSKDAQEKRKRRRTVF